MEQQHDLDPVALLDWLGCEYKQKHGRSGPQLNVKTCPRCGGSSWKVFLSAETGLGNCFHGACVGLPGFNLFSFARHTLGSADEAAKVLQSLGARTLARSRQSIESAVKTAGRWSLPESVDLPNTSAFEKGLPDYLIDRGFTCETAKKHKWRYCTRGSFTLDAASGQVSQRYDQRIILPVCDLSGEIVTFQGRDVTGKQQPKYLFPPGLPGSGRLLYNGHRAIGSPAIVIGEGVFDVAAIDQALQSVKGDYFFRQFVPVGSFGKHLSLDGADSQASKLAYLKQRGLQKIVLMWDGEPAALKAAMETGERLARLLNLEVKVARLPGKDPNEVEPEVVLHSLREAISVTGKSAALRAGMMMRLAYRTCA